MPSRRQRMKQHTSSSSEEGIVVEISETQSQTKIHISIRKVFERESSSNLTSTTEHILLREYAFCSFCFEVNPNHKSFSKIAVRQHRPQNSNIKNDSDVQFLRDLSVMTFNRRNNAEAASRFSNLSNVDESHRQTSINRTQRQSSSRSNADSITLFLRVISKFDIMISKIRTTITSYIRMMKMRDFERKKILKWEMLNSMFFLLSLDSNLFQY